MPVTHTPTRKTRPHRSSAKILCLAQITALVTGLAAVSAKAEELHATQASGLKIAILDLAEVPDLVPSQSVETLHTAWRTSFGSERQTEKPKPRIVAGEGSLAALAGIDAVLIQGVKAAAPLRRIFPPRSWRLIVSRRLISTDVSDGVATNTAALPPATAIAVRADENLRVTARTLALHLADTEPPQIASGPPAAATAIRLVDPRGRTFWLASVALPSACSTNALPCTARQSLDQWRKARREDGEATLVGGRTISSQPAPQKADVQPQACSGHGFDSDLKWKPVTPGAAENSPTTPKGCISIVQLDD
ncbi:hypothetical protein [Hyphomicrobium sp.]|uniref:hypothetical protein n=1 Tax=Hyphomicrobium sp. TaxID=82 RepID=UPI002E37EF1A|nr:hypothetical protein [Hyphomicrobium sp.]HEX2842956.1 hypothetical protein [Hyphomicrobium sp.]